MKYLICAKNSNFSFWLNAADFGGVSALDFARNYQILKVKRA